MSARRIFLLLFTLAITLMLYSFSYAVPIWEGYDEESFNLTEEGTTSWEDDLEAMEEKEIQKLINRIRNGDKNVMSYIVYQTYERLHFTVYAASLTYFDKNLVKAEADAIRKRFLDKFKDRYGPEDGKKFIDRVDTRYKALLGQDYYNILGYRKSVPAFIGGFNNQDPKVRLKAIGYLGDWVDDVSLDLNEIETAVEQRLASGLETRMEVRYGLEILRLKILRKRILNEIYKGTNHNVLKTIDPRDFLVLVRNEAFIRKIFGISDKMVRSIRLDPYIDRKLDIEKTVKSKNRADSLWRLDSVDFHYFMKNPDTFKIIFHGLQNPSLFVRENCVRLILEMITVHDDEEFVMDGGDKQKDGQKIFWLNDDGKEVKLKWDVGAGAAGAEVKDLIRIKTGILAEMSTQAEFINIAKKLWDDVVFSTYGNPSAGIEYTGSRNFYFLKGNKVLQDETNLSQGKSGSTEKTTVEQTATAYNDLIKANTVNEGDGIEKSRKHIGHLNYRIMVADLLRAMGLQWYLGEEEKRAEVVKAKEMASYMYLFNRNRDVKNLTDEFDRHDWLEGEVPQK